MADEKVTAQQCIDKLPRIFPELPKRHSSLSRWRSARGDIENYLQLLRTNRAVAESV
jgi:hypothetical protein